MKLWFERRRSAIDCMVHILDLPVGRGGWFVKQEECKKKVELDMHHMDKKKRREREREKGSAQYVDRNSFRGNQSIAKLWQ